MTTTRNTAGAFQSLSADLSHPSITLARLLGLIEARSAQRRQRIALERLDNRLRKDIGLPPRYEGIADHPISMSGGYF